MFDTLDLTPTDEARCGQCQARLVAERLGTTLYSFQLTDPDQILTWDVGRARQLAAERGAQPEPVSARQALEWVHTNGTIEQGHLMHLPDAALAEPILCDGFMLTERPGAPERFQPIIIDGSHRIVRCILARMPIRAIWLLPAEHHAVLSIRPGRALELLRRQP